MTGARAGGAIDALASRILGCRRCPRLVEHREATAREKVRRFAHWEYWGKPVPGFGDSRGRLWIIGLAPAAHGGNRTGRIFTGDRSGDWLFAALHRAGLANQPTSVSRDDGLVLQGVWVSAVVRCAPPGNRPSTEERDRCLPYLGDEIRLLSRVQVFVALGAFAFTNILRLLRKRGEAGGALPAFGHGVIVRLQSGRTLIGCYHPSQQNTFTGRLTEQMLDQVIERAQRVLGSRPGRHRGGAATR